MIHAGGIMSTVGCSVPWGTQITKDFPPTVLNTPTVLMISPHMHHDSPHSTEHPHGTQDIPHIYYDILHGTEHPTVLKISPTVLHTSYTG